jgi:AAA domain, putative AbiEii toxin, Type IV TA system
VNRRIVCFTGGSAVRIEQLDYRDKDSGWSLSAAEFFPDLTLLVGVSGVGKTKILRAIQTLQQFTTRNYSRSVGWGVAWKIHFTTSGNKYLWEGEYEGKPEGEEPGTGSSLGVYDEEDEDMPGPRIVRERLSRGEEVIVDRDGENIRFQQKITPKLSRHESVLTIFKEEDSIKPVVAGFGQIAYLDQARPEMGLRVYQRDSLSKQFTSIHAIRESNLPIHVKMALLSENDPPRFQSIVSQFRDVFPLVEDVRFERIEMEMFADVAELRVKEIGVDYWIPERQLSSGMFRTLMHLGSVALWPDESVILIDEFENSLGVNCLDDVTGDMMAHRNHLQFIVTSHHPYIINNISPSHWKLVTRQGGEVRTLDAAAAGIGKSRHEAFIQLMNSSLYRDGVAGQ